MRSLLILNIIAVSVLGCRSPSVTDQKEGGVTPSGSGGARLDSSPTSEVAKARPPVRNVILLSIDSLRADMPWAGYPRPIAPRITEFAKRSVTYTHAYSVSSYTSMSLGGLLAGRFPSELKRSGFFFGSYAKENLFFPELLQAAHIKTLGAHAHGYFKDAGFEQGFDRWEIVPNLKWNNTTDENVTSPAHEAIAERLLSDAGDGPFFAWFHFLDPHDQYISHEKEGIPPFGAAPRDRYDAEVLFTDRYVGKLLDFIAEKPWAKETAIILTADHGEAFGEHGQSAHGFELWENLVRVPLIVNLPGNSPRVVDVPRSAIDIAPTILSLFHLPAESTFVGVDLTPEFYGAPAPPRDVLLDLPMTSDNDRRRALLHGTKKVIAFGTDSVTKVFDVAEDPGELSPLKSDESAKEAIVRFQEASKGVHDTPPTRCNVGCLNGAYAKPKESSP